MNGYSTNQTMANMQAPAALINLWRRYGWLLIVLADAGLLLWGALAAAAPDLLPGPGSAPILAAGYEGFTHGSWLQLVNASPATAGFITLLFRVYGAFNAGFGLLAIAIAVSAYRRSEAWAWWALLIGNTIAFPAAMTYDRIAGAIGPLEASEYLGIAAVYVALAVSAPFLAKGRAAPPAS